MKVVGQVIFGSMLIGVVAAIDKIIVARRDTIVRGGRRLQTILNIPPCLSAISDTPPGIAEEALRRGSERAVFSLILYHCVFAAIVSSGKLRGLRALAFEIIGTTCIAVLIWYYFILERRRSDCGGGATNIRPDEGSQEKAYGSRHAGTDTGLQKSIQSIIDMPVCL